MRREGSAVKGLVFAVFLHRSHAESARRSLLRSAGAEREVRLHLEGMDPMVAVELDGCRDQVERERDASRRFLTVFAFFAAAGLAIDLLVLPPSTGLAATLLLGSLGVLGGTVSVLWERPRALELAFRDIDEALAQGHVLLTVPVTEDGRPAARRAIGEHGGRTVYDA